MPSRAESDAVAFPAATVVLLRDGASNAQALEVFLVERPATAAFMARAHVFPGGRVDPGDRDERLLAVADGVASLAPGPAGDDPGVLAPHGIAAVRELFEEAGVLLARCRGTPGGGSPAPAELASARAALRSGASDFATLCLERGWRPALDRLAPLAHWVTPVPERRRFDTRFFVAALPSGQEAAADGVEAVSGRWVTPHLACAHYDAGVLSLAPPTVRTLDDLSARSSVADAIAWARARPHVRVMPHPVHRDGRLWLVLPGDPLYPDHEGPGLRPPTRYVEVAGRWRAAE
jgi:8-oxo-dGTP pyrophosphatase MutT (NUDIX family)